MTKAFYPVEDVTDWKIDPAVQAERDRIANDIRAKEGAPSIEEQRSIVNKAQQKQNAGNNMAAEILDIKPAVNYSTSSNKKFYTIEEAEKAFYPVEETSSEAISRKTQEITEGFKTGSIWNTPAPSMLDATIGLGKFAVGGLDLLPTAAGFIGGAVGAAGSIPYTLATGGGLKEVGENASKVFEKVNNLEVLQPTTEAGQDMAAMFEAGSEGLKHMMQKGGVGLVKSFGGGTEAQAVAHGLGEALPDVIGMFGGHAAGRAALDKTKTKLPDISDVKKPETVSEVIDQAIGLPDVEIPPRQADLFDQETPWRTDEYGMPYKPFEEVGEPIQRDLFSPENMDNMEATGANKTPLERAIEKPGFLRTAEDLIMIRKDEQTKRAAAASEKALVFTDSINFTKNNPIWESYLREYVVKDRNYNDMNAEMKVVMNELAAKGENFTMETWASLADKHDLTVIDKTMARLFRNIVGDVPIKFTHGDLFINGESVKGYYSKPLNEIVVDLRAGFHEIVQTINHEGIHAATVGFLERSPRSDLSIAANALFMEVNKNKDTSRADPYGMTNAKEFFAELTNPLFLDYLNRTKVSKEFLNQWGEILNIRPINTWWHAFAKFLQKAFNTPTKETNAMSVALQALGKMRDEITKADVKKYQAEYRLQFGQMDGKVKKPFKFKEAGFRDSFTGEIFGTGNLHLKNKLPKEQQNKPAGVMEAGFIDEEGNFYTRKEAQQKLAQTKLKSNVTGGEIHSSNLFDREAKVKEKTNIEDIKDALNRAAKTASSKKELALILETQKLSDMDMAAALQEVDRIWDNKEAIKASFKNEAPATKSERIWANDNRSTKEMLEQEISDPTKIKDIDPTGLGLTTSAWASSIKMLDKYAPEAANILRHTYVKIGEIQERGNRLMDRAEPYFREFNKVTKDLFKTKANQIEVLKAFGDFEKNPDKWFNGKDYYPNKQQLLDYGLTEAQANGYLALTKPMEMLWDILDMTQAKLGRPPLRKIPGYIPHVWKGGYSFILEKEKAPNEWVPVKKYNFSTAHTANTVLKGLKKQGLGNLRVRKDDFGNEVSRPHMRRTNRIQDYIHDIRDTLDILGNQKGFAGLKSLLDKIDAGTTEGIIVQALERKMNMGGHQIDRLLKNELNNGEIKDLLTLHKDVYRSAVDFYESASYATEVWQPLKMAGLPQHLMKAVETTGDNFIGRNEGFDSWFQQHTQYMLSRAGLPTHIGKNIGKILTSLFSKWTLFGNIGFYVSNIVQPLNAIAAVLRADALARVNGEARGSIAKAFADTVKELPQTLLGKSESALMAKSTGKAKPVMLEHFDPKGRFRDRIAEKLEEEGRQVSFALGYHYFKQTMPRKAAFEAAGQLTDQAMVPYDRALGRPTALNEIGDVASVFATYMLHDFGQLAYDIKLAANNPKKLSSYAPLVGYQAMKYSLYGLTGLSIMNNIEDLLRALNNAGLTDASVKQMAREIDGPGNDMAEFGLLSTAMGMDISASGAGAAVSFPAAGVADMIIGMTTTVINANKEAAHRLGFKDTPVSTEAWAETIKYMPNIARGSLEIANDSKDAREFAFRMYDMAMGKPDPRDTLSKKYGTVEGEYRRTTKEAQIKTFFGKRSIDEAKFANSLRIFKNKEKLLTSEQGKMLDALKDDFRYNNLKPEVREMFLQKLGERMGLTGAEIKSAIERSYVDRNFSLREQEDFKASKADSPKAKMRYQRFTNEIEEGYK